MVVQAVVEQDKAPQAVQEIHLVPLHHKEIMAAVE
jgi:hypothetical protein